MSAIKITKFLGTAPKNAGEHLPDTAAQIAQNCKLYSGDLIPYPQPVVADSCGRSGTVRTIYGIRNSRGAALKWLSWANDVDVATPATDDVENQRFYYTGDGVPKVSTYDLAISGAGPYPANAYTLGLPLPTAVTTVSATSFSVVSSSTFARDAGGNITLVTGSAHNLKNGALATITGFAFRTGTYSRTGTTITVTITAHGLATGARIYIEFTSGTATTNQYTITKVDADNFTCVDTASGATSGDARWDIRDLNATAEITVINSTTISYYSAGPAVTTTSNTDGRVDLGGQVLSRNYLFTYLTPWGEESIGSEPSTTLFVKEGQTVTVGNIAASQPAGTFIRAYRLYRTLSGTSDAAYYRLATLWFPIGLTHYARSSNVSTVTFDQPHGRIADDRFKLTGASDGSFNITGGVVIDIIDDYSFTYANAGANVSTTAAAPGGWAYFDVAESDAVAARYWGDGGVYDFTDDFNYRSLTNVLTTNDYDPPPEGLTGLTVVQNNILVGFSGTDLYFSEVNQFHAWPVKYKKSFESSIIGLAQIGGNLLVLTETYPYVVYGSDPAVMTQTKLSSRYPCLNRRSIVETSFGVVYATHDGLVVYSPSVAAQLLTKLVHVSDTWNSALDPSSIIGVMYKDAYIASHSSAMIVFENNDKTGPAFVDCTYTFNAAWYDAYDNSLYYSTGSIGDIYKWDDAAQPKAILTWKSKVLVTKDYSNIGAARVIADYGTATTEDWVDNDTSWADEASLWDATDPVTFSLYVNKQLLTTVIRTSDAIFRLPTGYKADTFEVAVAGDVRVRAIHLGESPSSLRDV